MIRMGAITSFRLYFIPRTASHLILGEQHGQSEKESSGTKLIHHCRHQVAKAAFEGKNASTENRKGYEKVRRVFEAEGLEARDWPWPSAMSAVLGSRAQGVFSTKQPLLPRRPPTRVAFPAPRRIAFPRGFSVLTETRVFPATMSARNTRC